MPCARGEHCPCSTTEMPLCAHWTPGRSSRYYRCERYLAGRVTCDLPRSACATCPHFLPPCPREAQRDWSDPEDRKRYQREYMRRYRKDEA